jgi:hypothetical protein
MVSDVKVRNAASLGVDSVQELAEQSAQLCLFVLVEARHETLLGEHVLCHRLVDHVVALVREPNEAAAAVGRVGYPRDETFALEAV